MARFNIIWDIENIEAKSPYDAAQRVQNWLRKDDWMFYVQNVETGEIFSVDLQEEEVDAVLPVRKFESVIKNK
ncbi:MAG TPA: hypothetical protein PK698_06710 [Bacilli bacterium]|jgi:hypothetical protein|nr:MAG: hypothetical protein BWX59_02264 [Bacteroidetes bacterium ADurb.Bin028]HOH62143.1 hypothetical protein [Bacilli bacterium]